jgi:hypothetical protein
LQIKTNRTNLTTQERERERGRYKIGQCPSTDGKHQPVKKEEKQHTRSKKKEQARYTITKTRRLAVFANKNKQDKPYHTRPNEEKVVGGGGREGVKNTMNEQLPATPCDRGPKKGTTTSLTH